MTREEIKTRVLAKLDEIETMTGASQSPSDELIDALMDESALNMLRNAPIHLIPPIKVNVSALNFVHVKDLTNGTGYIALPNDFLRLYSFKMEAWERPAFDYISVSNPEYFKQKIRNLRGGVSKPVVAVNYNDTGDGIDPDPEIEITETAPEA